MRLLHTAARTSATFDDPNLVSHAGLVLAERPVDEHMQVAAKVGVNANVKVGALLAGMVAGAIDGMDLLRHGAFPPGSLGSGHRRRRVRFARSSKSASMRANNRQIVDSSGRAGPCTPSSRSTSALWSATATNEQAPASTAAGPTAGTAADEWRTPCRLRGSVTVERTVTRCSRRVVVAAASTVGEDDIDECGPRRGGCLSNSHPSPTGHTRYSRHAAFRT